MVGSVGRTFRVRREFRRTGVGVIYDSRYFYNDWFPELLVLCYMRSWSGHRTRSASPALGAQETPKLVRDNGGASRSLILEAKKDPRRERCV